MPVTDGNDIQAHFKALRASGMTYRAIAERYGISAGLAWKIENDGLVPKRNDIRRKLGLSFLCPRCGLEIENG